MNKNFTPNDLVRYLYRETSLSETVAIREALQENYSLQQQYEGLVSGYKQLPKVKFRPTANTLNSVLRYSSRPAVEHWP